MTNQVVKSIVEVVRTFEHAVLDSCQVKDPELQKCIEDLEEATEKEFSWFRRKQPADNIDELFEFFIP